MNDRNEGPVPGEERPYEKLDVPAAKPPRVSDKIALSLLAAYLVFRTVTGYFGWGLAPRLIDSAPWLSPLLNNRMIILMMMGTGVEGRWEMFAATMAASLFMATVAGLILYWAGYRFGPRLAVLAERSGSIWASLWNPKQVEKAHRWTERWGVFAVSLGRLVEWLTTPVLLVAGSVRMSFGKYLAAHTVGALGFAGGSLWVGVVLGDRFEGLKGRIEGFSTWALRIALAALLLFVVTAFLARGQEDKQPTETPSGEEAP